MIHPRYVFALAILVAVIVIPTLVFFGVIADNAFLNAIVVGVLAAALVLYKSRFKKNQPSS